MTSPHCCRIVQVVCLPAALSGFGFLYAFQFTEPLGLGVLQVSGLLLLSSFIGYVWTMAKPHQYRVGIATGGFGVFLVIVMLLMINGFPVGTGPVGVSITRSVMVDNAWSATDPASVTAFQDANACCGYNHGADRFQPTSTCDGASGFGSVRGCKSGAVALVGARVSQITMGLVVIWLLGALVCRHAYVMMQRQRRLWAADPKVFGRWVPSLPKVTCV